MNLVIMQAILHAKMYAIMYLGATSVYCAAPLESTLSALVYKWQHLSGTSACGCGYRQHATELQTSGLHLL